MFMLLTVIMGFLGLCGIGLVLWGIGEVLLSYTPENVYHIIPLKGESSEVEQRVRGCLRSLKGRLYFVDCGLEAEEQMTVELLLRHEDAAVLCAWEQVFEDLRWENEFGS